MTTRAYGATRPYHYRRLSPERERAVRAAVSAGACARDVAAQYGVNVRTVYRTLTRSAREHREVRLGDYVATFEITDEGPVQTGPWVPA